MVIQYFKPQQDPVALRLLKLNCFSLFHSHFFLTLILIQTFQVML